MEEFNLSEKRKELEEVCLKNFKEFKRGNFVELFEAIKNQDKEFIKRLKDELKVHEKVNPLIVARIDKLAGKEISK